MSESSQNSPEAGDAELAKLEARFPALSGQAFAAAAERSRQAGHTVTQSVGRRVFQISPEGKRTMVKSLPNPIKVKVGSKIRIQ